MKPDKPLGQKEILLPIFKTFNDSGQVAQTWNTILSPWCHPNLLSTIPLLRASAMTLLLEVIALFQVIINFIPTRITQAQDQLSEDVM